MNKKIVASILATFILASFHLTEAQQPKKRIGVFHVGWTMSLRLWSLSDRS